MIKKSKSMKYTCLVWILFYLDSRLRGSFTFQGKTEQSNHNIQTRLLYFFPIIGLFSFQAFSQTYCQKAGLAFKNAEINTRKSPETGMRHFATALKIMGICYQEIAADKASKQINCEQAKLNFKKVKSIYEKGKITNEKHSRMHADARDLYTRTHYAWMRAARTWVNKADKNDPTDKEIWNKANKAFDRAFQNLLDSDVILEKFKASPAYQSSKEASKAKALMINVCLKKNKLCKIFFPDYLFVQFSDFFTNRLRKSQTVSEKG